MVLKVNLTLPFRSFLFFPLSIHAFFLSFTRLLLFSKAAMALWVSDHHLHAHTSTHICSQTCSSFPLSYRGESKVRRLPPGASGKIIHPFSQVIIIGSLALHPYTHCVFVWIILTLFFFSNSKQSHFSLMPPQLGRTKLLKGAKQ